MLINARLCPSSAINGGVTHLQTLHTRIHCQGLFRSHRREAVPDSAAVLEKTVLRKSCILRTTACPCPVH